MTISRSLPEFICNYHANDAESEKPESRGGSFKCFGDIF